LERELIVEGLADMTELIEGLRGGEVRKILEAPEILAGVS